MEGTHDMSLFGRTTAKPVPQSPALSPSEESRLTELRSIVKRGLQSWQAAAAALAEIRERQLYRSSHRSFAAFCQAEFDLSGRRCAQLIESFGIIQELRDQDQSGVVVADLSESAVRALAPIPPAERLAVLSEASQAEPGVAASPRPRDVKAAVRRRLGKSVAKPVRVLVPGYAVVITPNKKASGDVRAALVAALEQLDRSSAGAAKAA
jgi:hypothetical protein